MHSNFTGGKMFSGFNTKLYGCTVGQMAISKFSHYLPASSTQTPLRGPGSPNLFLHLREISGELQIIGKPKPMQKNVFFETRTVQERNQNSAVSKNTPGPVPFVTTTESISDRQHSFQSVRSVTGDTMLSCFLPTGRQHSHSTRS